ncbi:16S rRNA (guanine(966)-N(2))-methyltransferase RsmD [Selenomonas ruminantium]|uniref:16S rRNA (Guanine(966)-N(2))-methyltransferase RsmD n=1 Tax=Selenomonas ruminantium TaxID=971 RepID=A0A1M6VWW4_SELRU|nr:16S rRNA (guanine(966)-N(2))-methyltransferase RsmD [Selenomonas ruminantium]SHK85951.1 16S rRNA (guanine(966)-N(2))-methyltransferase RsmD [Selenomonas ruminantium]
MRIITGSARGCRLKTPKGAEVTRPTADRVKESLFNILGNMVVGRKVLDIFAGTGNLGLEALSRGAQSAVFVDKATAKLIEENLRLTRLAEKARVCSCDVFAELARQGAGSAEFSLIFCDPPYHKGLWQQALRQIDQSEGLLAENGILVVEHGADENDVPELKRLLLVHNRRYGHTTQISFFQWRSYVDAEEEDA